MKRDMQGKALTTDEKGRFIRKLRLTHGNVAKACTAIKLSRTAAYAHRSSDASFAEAWDEAVETSTDLIEEELHRRAVKGVREPVFYKGEEVATVKKFSDQLLMFLLKARRPQKYRETYEVNTTVSGRLDLNIEAAINDVYGNDDELGLDEEIKDAKA